MTGDLPVAPAGERAPDGKISWEIPAPAEDLEVLEAAAGLFGAAAPPRYTPVPVLAVDGVDVASGPGPDGRPAGVIVLDGLSVRWGRDDVLAQADPATGSVTLFDPTRRWHSAADRIGQLVTLRWTGGGLVPGSGSGTGTFFRGRIATVQAARHTVTYPDGTEVTGSLVTMTLTSILADLANKVPTDAWPAETLGLRRQRVETLAVQTGLQQVLTRGFWQDPQVAPVAAADQVSVWDHLISLYDSSGADRYTYWPPDQFTVHLPRRYLPDQRGWAGLWWETAAEGNPRAGQGIYARSYGINRPEAIFGGVAMYIDAAALEFDDADGLVRKPSSRISRVQVDSVDSGTAYSARTVTQYTAVNEGLHGVRAARLDTILAWNSFADLAGKDLAEFASKEGAAWHLNGPVRWRTALSGGFEHTDSANALLYGGEVQSFFFLQRSWLPEFGLRPVFGLIGQTIGYQDGGWVLDLELSPVVSDVRQHAITWEEIDNGTTPYEVQWWDTDHPRGMHESLTYEDLGYVSTGLAVNTIPPDQGYDR